MIRTAVDRVRKTRRGDRTVWKRIHRSQGTQWSTRVHQYGFSDYHRELFSLLGPMEGKQILECGVGTGWPLGLAVARECDSFIGVDISDELIRECLSNFTDQGLSARCSVGDIEALPYRAEAADITYCFSVSWELPDLVRALQEMKRVTRRGGLIAFDIVNSWHPSQAATYLYAVGLAFLQRTKRRFQGRSIEDCHVTWTVRSPLQIRRILRGLGLDATVRGFYVLLPFHLPIVGYRFNLAERSQRMAFGLQDHPILKWFGAKLVYVCKV